MGYIFAGKEIPAQNIDHQKDLDLMLMGLPRQLGFQRTRTTWAPVQAGNAMNLAVPVRRRSHPTTLSASSTEQTRVEDNASGIGLWCGGMNWVERVVPPLPVSPPASTRSISNGGSTSAASFYRFFADSGSSSGYLLSSHFL